MNLSEKVTKEIKKRWFFTHRLQFMKCLGMCE